MRVIVVEDEIPAANRLTKMLQNLGEEIEVVARLDSVEATVKYLQQAEHTDLIFLDIQLADGLSFDIFTQVQVSTPIIFTTAFEQYSLKAFKVNSIDYLLKPVDENELKQAVNKYRLLHKKPGFDMKVEILKLAKYLEATSTKERLLIKKGQQLGYLKIKNIAFCYADGKLCYAVDFSSNKFLLENNLLQLEEQLPGQAFFRINRTLLVNIDAVQKVHTWLGGRLKVDLLIPNNTETIVSRERVNSFKLWLGDDK